MRGFGFLVVMGALTLTFAGGAGAVGVTLEEGVTCVEAFGVEPCVEGVDLTPAFGCNVELTADPPSAACFINLGN